MIQGACGKHLTKVVQEALTKGAKFDSVLVTTKVEVLPHPWCMTTCSAAPKFVVSWKQRDNE